jgi:hypothetical protein
LRATMTKREKIQLIGLDFETSTGDPRTLVPIQIGITTGSADFESLIGGWTFDDSVSYRWSEESAKVHNIPQDKLTDAPDVFEVDIFASAYMLSEKDAPRMGRVIVGWNVGSFDRHIIRKFMPNLNEILSYRTLDLNAVCFSVADKVGGSYSAIKKQVKSRAAGAIGGENWHDALFDAKAALLAYEYLLEIDGSND